MLRSVVAVLSGFAVTFLLVMVLAAGAALAFGLPLMVDASQPAPQPGAGYLAANLLISVVAAVAGGWTTARLSAHSPHVHAIALAAFIALMGSLSLRVPQPGQPDWYPWALVIIGPLGVLAGGMLHRSPASAVRPDTTPVA